MKKSVYTLIILLLTFDLGYNVCNLFNRSKYNELKKDIIDEIGSSKQINNYSELKGTGTHNPLSKFFSNKSEAIKKYPFLKTYLENNPDVNWRNLEKDWVLIQDEIMKAGENSEVSFPKTEKGYRINRPIFLRQGQTLSFAPNTKIIDETDDYAFKIIGGIKFPNEAITHVCLRNLNIVGNPHSKGAIELKNAYLVNLDNVSISNYNNREARAISLQDFFQININTLQVNNIKQGTGVFVDSINGNSGQLNFINTIIQRCNIGLFIKGSRNLIDGINMVGGSIGNNYSTGVVIDKNVHNVNFIGNHFENHDGKFYSGKTAISLEPKEGATVESINFIGNFFVNNKYSIRSDNAKRVSITGNEFDGRNIKGSVAIRQSAKDSSWVINPNQFINNSRNLVEAGSNNMNLSSINVDSSGVIYPQKSGSGIYSGSKDPNGNIKADAGSIYLRTNPRSKNQLYIKQGNNSFSGWKPVAVKD